MPGKSADVLIIGDGIAALTLSLALSRRGLRVHTIGTPRPGLASTAAAGLLAPTIGAAPPTARAFGLAALQAYPTFLARLEELSGQHVTLGPQGILEIALTDAQFEALRSQTSPEALLFDPRIVVEMEPRLAPVAGALFHAADSVVDTGELMAALTLAVERDERIEFLRAEVTGVDLGGDGATVNAGSFSYAAPTLVLAAGAWSGGIAGLPRAVPVEPARGQMISFDARLLNHAVMGPGGYLVPRRGRTVAGSTLEHVGFDASTTPEALDRLVGLARTFAPIIGSAPRQAAWTGLRPVTPDMLPILGRDPEHPRLIYACGHSKNGILTAPLAAECVAAEVVGEAPSHDITAFSVARFANSGAVSLN